jgi:hypothetical protein
MASRNLVFVSYVQVALGEDYSPEVPGIVGLQNVVCLVYAGYIQDMVE